MDYLCVHTVEIKKKKKETEKEGISLCLVVVMGNFALLNFRLVFDCGVRARGLFSFYF